jgi:hypothetical protein
MYKSRLCRADHVCDTYLMLQRELSHLNCRKLDHRQVSDSYNFYVWLQFVLFCKRVHPNLSRNCNCSLLYSVGRDHTQNIGSSIDVQMLLSRLGWKHHYSIGFLGRCLAMAAVPLFVSQSLPTSGVYIPLHPNLNYAQLELHGFYGNFIWNYVWQLRSQQQHIYFRHFHYFWELIVHCSSELVTVPTPEPEESNSYPPIILIFQDSFQHYTLIYVYVFLTTLSFRVIYKTSYALLFQACQLHPPWFAHPNSIYIYIYLFITNCNWAYARWQCYINIEQ